jgi:hypothetical protein
MPRDVDSTPGSLPPGPRAAAARPAVNAPPPSIATGLSTTASEARDMLIQGLTHDDYQPDTPGDPLAAFLGQTGTHSHADNAAFKAFAVPPGVAVMAEAGPVPAPVQAPVPAPVPAPTPAIAAKPVAMTAAPATAQTAPASVAAPAPKNSSSISAASKASPTYAGVFQPFEVTPGISVPSHLGAHFGPATQYSDQAKVNDVLDRMKAAGVGYSTIVVNGANPGSMDNVIKAMKDRGIEPVVRFVPNGDYNKPLSNYTPDDIKQYGDTAAHLQSMGIKTIQLDNEPDLLHLPQSGKEFTEVMHRYAQNEAALIQAVHLQAPGMAVGLPPMSFSEANTPGREYAERFFKTNLQNLAALDKASGGKLLDNTFLATHPYDSGSGAGGPTYNERYRQMAFDAAGRHFNTLATEGGNPRQGTSGQTAWQIHEKELQHIAQNPNDTQNLWIIAGGYLDGSNGEWEGDALIHRDGAEDPTLKNLRKVFNGTY